MEELVARLKKCNLPESMGLQFRENPPAVQIVTPVGFVSPPLWVFFDTDEAPGTALFIVRGLKALGDAGRWFNLENQSYEGEFVGYAIETWMDGFTSGPKNTMAQAVAEALIQAFSTGTEGDNKG